ncbi:MAG: isoaspartyl peptidase/L-asparaginase family protein [Terriglobia bacterium]
MALAVHGGAWAIPDELLEACRAGVARSLSSGWEVLSRGGSALDACQSAIAVLEDDPAFDAGLGSHLNRDARVQLDAVLMDGRTLNSGAIAGVERLRNPIQVARLVLERSEHILLVGPGAEQFAAEMGVPLCNPSELVIPREVALWFKRSAGAALPRQSGTVGAVALDAQGNLAAGTSTGGPPYKYPGRVGDSPLVGCGCYADNRTGAISTTGDGEAMVKLVMAKTASDFLAAGPSRPAGGLAPQPAAEKALALLSERTRGTGGLIIVDAQGRVGAAFTTPCMAHAFQTSESERIIRV